MVLSYNEYISKNQIDGNTTEKLQSFFDYCVENGLEAFLNEGTYEVGPLFLKSNQKLIMDDNTILLATIDESMYTDIYTRVAGIECDWYPAILNVIDASDVVIKGGTINGNGPYWWNKYWGSDMKSGMREEYDKKGLRFLCDYDCKRPRNMLIQNSNHISVIGTKLIDSGFWNLHVLYSKYITLSGINIDVTKPNSPSTDGIDIDSSCFVNVNNCITNTNDDSVAIKSGRDSDGLRVNKPSHNITIQNCKILKGFGITIGSELSGGVYRVEIKNNEFYGTDCGFRIKSSEPRKGYVKMVYVHDIKMVNVKYLFHINLDWNPKYCKCKLPFGYKGEKTEVLTKLITPSPKIKNTKVEDLIFENITAYNEENYTGISRAFELNGFKDSKIENLTFKNICTKTKEYGRTINTKKIKFENSNFEYLTILDDANNEFDNR